MHQVVAAMTTATQAAVVVMVVAAAVVTEVDTAATADRLALSVPPLLSRSIGMTQAPAYGGTRQLLICWSFLSLYITVVYLLKLFNCRKASLNEKLCSHFQ